MKKMVKMLWISIISLGISASVLAGPNQDVGSIVGGIAGGLIGNNVGHGSGRTIATIGGAVVGSMVGSQVGHSVDRTERYAYDPYQPQGPYVVHETRYMTPYHHTFIGQNGRLCRRYVYIDEYGDRIHGTACCYRMNHSGRCLRWVAVA